MAEVQEFLAKLEELSDDVHVCGIGLIGICWRSSHAHLNPVAAEAQREAATGRSGRRLRQRATGSRQVQPSARLMAAKSGRASTFGWMQRSCS